MALRVVGPLTIVFAVCSSDVVAVEPVDSVGETVVGPDISVFAERLLVAWAKDMEKNAKRRKTEKMMNRIAKVSSRWQQKQLTD